MVQRLTVIFLVVILLLTLKSLIISRYEHKVLMTNTIKLKVVEMCKTNQDFEKCYKEKINIVKKLTKWKLDDIIILN